MLYGFLVYKIYNYINAHKKNTASLMPVFMELASANQH